MPDLSLGKLLFLLLIILVVWNGFKYLGRVEQMRRGLREDMRRRHPGAQDRDRPLVTEDLVKCPPCGAYVATGSQASCGRADCPWGH